MCVCVYVSDTVEVYVMYNFVAYVPLVSLVWTELLCRRVCMGGYTIFLFLEVGFSIFVLTLLLSADWSILLFSIGAGALQPIVVFVFESSTTIYSVVFGSLSRTAPLHRSLHRQN